MDGRGGLVTGHLFYKALLFFVLGISCLVTLLLFVSCFLIGLKPL